MKRQSVFVALVMLVPLAAAAQSPAPVPPVPPAAPAAPAPRPSPVPPVPPVQVRIAPMIDTYAIEEAVRASRDAIGQLDMDAIRQEAREAAQQARDMAQQQREMAREMSQHDMQMHEFSLPSMNFNYDFNFDFQNSFTSSRSGDTGAYSSGLSSIQSGKYDQAVAMFDRVIAQKGTRTDAALYWKAFAQYRLSKSDDALATIAELRKSYAQSRYLADARVLEADAKKANGQPLNVDVNDDEIKILAIQALQTTDPARAVPLLENVLKNTNTLKVKKQALFVLASNDQPAAHAILLSYAKGGGNPDLQLEAIRYLVSKRNANTTAELMSIYDSTQDLDVRTAIVNALANAGDRTGLIRVINTPTGSPEVRRVAINRLGNDNMATPQDLMQIYAKEEDKTLRQEIVRALGSIGAVDQLVQVARTDKEMAVRQQAIRSLGNQKSERTGQALIDLYAAQTDPEVRKSIMSALANQNNAEGLIAIARKETNSDLKISIVRKIADLASNGKSKAAADYMAEFIK